MKNVLVIGGGSWGSCLAKLLVENGSNVYLWEHNEKNREIMTACRAVECGYYTEKQTWRHSFRALQSKYANV